MSVLNFRKTDNQLILHYETETDWLEKIIKEEDDFLLYRTFLLSKKDLISKKQTFSDYRYDFVLGLRNDNYYKIEKEKIGINFDLFIEKTLMVDRSWFVTSSAKSVKYRNSDNEERSTSIYGNILYAFNGFYKNSELYIDGDSEETFQDDGFHITMSTYKHFVKIFPTATNVKYQTLSIFTNLLKNELDVVDYEELYSRYKSKRVSVHNRTDIFSEEIRKQDKIKFIYVRDLLMENLTKCEKGEFIHEDDFSELIAQFFCYINPKYVKIKTKLNITDYTDARSNCQADLCLIDCDGNIDLIEVKSPKAYRNLFRKRP